MRILDLYAGLGGEERRSFIESRGHEYITLDYAPEFKCNITKDIFDVTAASLGRYDLIWASPPCECFSVASISHHWRKEIGIYIPQTQDAIIAINLVTHTIKIIKDINPAGWLIENPRGMLRKMPFMEEFPRVTVTYCQYGENRMKPTDLWGYIPNWTPRKPCNNGDSCHEASPRGSRTGTQGIKGAARRAVVPLELWKEILISMEKTL